MNQQVNRQASPATDRANPVVLPDVANPPHPTPHPNEAFPPDEGEGATVLEDALPEITEAARKVGGFKRLSEIAAQLDRAGIGE
jgi:hypothetical protein